jgi:hypothetical protein
MRWLDPQPREFAPGRRGSIVVLADHSDSVSSTTQMAISQALQSLRRRIPSARLYAFHADIEEVPADRDFFGTFPPTGASRWGRRFANTTDLGYCLGRIAPLNPTKTILFSDGGCRNKRNTLRVVEQMTGSIDAFFCEPDPAHYDENHPTGRTAEQMFQLLTRDVDEGLMQQIARCGRGRFIRFHPDRVNLQSELAISTEETAPMRRRYPDHHVPGDQINVVVREPRFFDAREHVHVQHGVVVHHHHAAPQHLHHGAPAVQDVHVGETEVRVECRRSFWAELLLGPAVQPAPALAPPQRQQYQQQAPQIAPPQRQHAPAQEVYRGEIYSEPVPQHRALPAPLARPQQAGQPLAIPYQPEQPMSAAAAFNSKAKVRR